MFLKRSTDQNDRGHHLKLIAKKLTNQYVDKSQEYFYIKMKFIYYLLRYNQLVKCMKDLRLYLNLEMQYRRRNTVNLNQLHSSSYRQGLECIDYIIRRGGRLVP